MKLCAALGVPKPDLDTLASRRDRAKYCQQPHAKIAEKLVGLKFSQEIGRLSGEAHCIEIRY